MSADGELLELRRDKSPIITSARTWSSAERERWHGMFAWIERERGYSPKWAAANYKQKFGAWPPWGSKSRQIAYAKAISRVTQ